jgi:hypothetical protein
MYTKEKAGRNKNTDDKNVKKPAKIRDSPDKVDGACYNRFYYH